MEEEEEEEEEKKLKLLLLFNECFLCKKKSRGWMCGEKADYDHSYWAANDDDDVIRVNNSCHLLYAQFYNFTPKKTHSLASWLLCRWTKSLCLYYR